MRKLPKGWTLRYFGVGVYPSSRQYAVCYHGIYWFAISVDQKPGTGARLTIEDHIDYIYQRNTELCGS